MQMDSSMGARLHYARKWMGISLRKVGAKMNVSQQFVQHLETCDTLTGYQLNRLSIALGLSIPWLETGVGPMFLPGREVPRYETHKEKIERIAKAYAQRRAMGPARAEYMRELRRDLNISQKTLAAAIGTVQTAISSYENGKTLISDDVMERIEAALPWLRESAPKMEGKSRCHEPHNSKTVSVDDVKEITWKALKKKAEMAARLLAEPVDKPDVDVVEKEIQRLKEALMDRYESFADGKISKDEYIAFRDENKAKTAEMEQKLSLAKGREEYLSRRLEALKPLAEIANAEELTREMLLKVADAVYWNDGEVELKLKADEFLVES